MIAIPSRVRYVRVGDTDYTSTESTDITQPTDPLWTGLGYSSFEAAMAFSTLTETINQLSKDWIELMRLFWSHIRSFSHKPRAKRKRPSGRASVKNPKTPSGYG